MKPNSFFLFWYLNITFAEAWSNVIRSPSSSFLLIIDSKILAKESMTSSFYTFFSKTVTLKLNKKPEIAVKRLRFVSSFLLKFSTTWKMVPQCFAIPFLLVFWIIIFVNVLKTKAQYAYELCIYKSLQRWEIMLKPASRPENRA